jgi:hypothetical protein
MSLLANAFRCTAMALLLFVAAEVISCDILHCDDCYTSSQLPGHDGNQTSPAGDSCTCCCAHVTVASVFVFDPQMMVLSAPVPVTSAPPAFDLANVEHPPQLS